MMVQDMAATQSNQVPSYPSRRPSIELLVDSILSRSQTKKSAVPLSTLQTEHKILSENKPRPSLDADYGGYLLAPNGDKYAFGCKRLS